MNRTLRTIAVAVGPALLGLACQSSGARHPVADSPENLASATQAGSPPVPLGHSSSAVAPSLPDATAVGGKKPRRNGSTPPSTSSEPPAEEDATEAERLEAPGHTRGNIACGAARCNAANQSCFSGAEWSCVPRDQESHLAIRYDCDDASDCPAGKACCLSFASAADVYACSPRSGKETDCRLEVCVSGEGAAACPPGQRCTNGVCRPKTLPALCAGQRCSASHPICVWSEGRQSCQSWEQAQTGGDAPTSILRCSEPRDCGAGFQCCTNALWEATHCALHCDSANNGVLCTRPADCGNDADGKPLACRKLDPSDPHTPRSLPPWIKVCQAH